MRAIQTILVLFLLGFTSAAGAVVKLYDSTANNGSAGDAFLNSTNLYPPIVTTPDIVLGLAELDDPGLGTVTVNSLSIVGGAAGRPGAGPTRFDLRARGVQLHRHQGHGRCCECALHEQHIG